MSPTTSPYATSSSSGRRKLTSEAVTSQAVESNDVMQIRADFHTHSIGEGTFGPNSEALVARHLEAACEVGLACIAVSDHNDLRPGLLAREYAARHQLPLLVIPGIELTTQE